MEFTHPAGLGGVCYELLKAPNHRSRRRGQAMWSEKPATTAPTQQLAPTFANSQASCGFRGNGFSAPCFICSDKGEENSPFFAQKSSLVEPHAL